MSEPSELLGSAAQVAITLAGFAGVVVVFARDAVHVWSPVDKFRLRLMLLGAAMSLLLCMFGLVLIAAALPESLQWRLASAGTLAVQLPSMLQAQRHFARFPAEELQRTHANPRLFYAISGVGFAVVLLQIVNAALLAQFWPFFVAVASSQLVSLLQFVRLILTDRPGD